MTVAFYGTAKAVPFVQGRQTSAQPGFHALDLSSPCWLTSNFSNSATAMATGPKRIKGSSTNKAASSFRAPPGDNRCYTPAIPAFSGGLFSKFGVCERAMQTASEEHIAVTRKLPGRRYDKVFFGCMVVLLLLIVFVGFAHSYYLAGVFRAHLPAPILHIHGALNTLWMLLLVVQTILISAKKIKWHMTLGIAGFALAVAMVGVGFVVSANQLHRHASDPRILSFETIPFLEQVSFAVLAGAAFALRKKAAAHKRLILLATIVMMAAAFSRFPVQVPDSEKFAVYGIYVLLGSMVLYDVWSLHRVHGATVFGVLLILAYLNFAPPIGQTAAWQRFALWMQSLNLRFSA